MCFYNRYKWACGHQQYSLFTLCEKGRRLPFSCLPKARKMRKNDVHGPCENCLHKYNHNPYSFNRTNLYSRRNVHPRLTDREMATAAALGGAISPYSGYQSPYSHRRYAGAVGRAAECPSPDCRTIAVPGDVDRRNHLQGIGAPHRDYGSQRLLHGIGGGNAGGLDYLDDEFGGHGYAGGGYGRHRAGMGAHSTTWRGIHGGSGGGVGDEFGYGDDYYSQYGGLGRGRSNSMFAGYGMGPGVAMREDLSIEDVL